MRKLIFTLLLFSCSFLLKAQTTVFSEDFETLPLTNVSSTCFNINTRIQTSGTNSDTAFVDGAGSICYLETVDFDCTNNYFVQLSFKSIAKIEFFDNATIEYSTDAGNSWNQLIDAGFGNPNNNCTYLGTGLFVSQGSRFCEGSYASWLPGQSVVPDNSWWQDELFDISFFAANNIVRLRFKLADGNNNGAGARNGWAIEDIGVEMNLCEITPPSVVLLNQYPPTVYSTGPFVVNATVTDLSGIALVNLNYTIGTDPTVYTLQMNNIQDSTFQETIPVMNIGDSVCYWIEAYDNSFCNNVTILPTICFVVQEGVTFPYCDDFDLATGLWHGYAEPGSAWELGTPAFGATSSAHSAPNAWDVNLTSAYTNNANCVLLGPEFSFIPVGAGSTLSFWQNRNSEGGWDGTRLEWSSVDSVAGPWNVLMPFIQGSPNCVDCVNWYTDDQLNSSALPAWEGSSGGWIKSSVILDSQFNGLAKVYFRFVFTSDGSVITDGFSIDDFCITLPQPDDVGVNAISQPGATAPANNCFDVIVNVKNYGLNAQTTFPVSYQINGGPIVTATFTGSLAPGASAQFTFPTCDSLPPGPYCICSWTSLPGDGNNLNDTTCSCGTAIPTYALTHCDDFEGGNTGYQTASTNVAAAEWQLGLPAYGATTGAFSGTNAFDINLAGPYGVGVTADLITPIYTLTGVVNPSISFRRNQSTAINDGLRIYYDINGTGVWNILGTVNDPDGYNWYNNFSLDFTGIPGWDGTTNGWIESRYYLQNIMNASGTANFIQFRFEFISGFNGIPTDGVSIDDLCVKLASPDDVGVFSVNSPTITEPAQTCIPITVTIRNYGSLTQTTFPVSYSINGGTTVTAQWTGSLAPNATAQFTFPNCDSNFVAGINGFCAWTELPGDGDSSNDTTCIDVLGIPVLTPTACDDFEGGNLGYQTTTTDPVSAEWQLGAPAFGATTGAHSGTNAWDINLTNGYGFNVTAELYTPIYNVSSSINPYLSFWRNQNTAGTDGVRISYEVDNNGTWTVLGIVGDPDAMNWYNNLQLNFGAPGWTGSTGGYVESRYYLQNLITINLASTLRFRFEFVSGFAGAPNDGVSIDDICVKQPGPDDVGVVAILSPTAFAPAASTLNVDVTLRNFGSLTQTNFPVTYQITDIGGPQPPVTFTFNGSLAPNATTAFTMGTFVVPQGSFDFCAWTGLPTDSDHSNDTTCIGSVGIPVIPLSYTQPYIDNFDVTNVGWSTTTGNPSTIWELGPPAFGATNTAHSAPNAWDVNLNTSYNNSADCYLYSPIFNLTNAVDPKLSFWRNSNTEQNWDGVRCEVSIDGAPFVLLGTANAVAPCWVNWYNMPSIQCSQQPAWAGATGGWVKTEANCLGAWDNHMVQLRFYFCSDASVIVDGFSIDDVNITIPVPLTASPITINTNTINTGFIFPGQSVQFTSPISNPGTTPLTSVNATITITPVGQSIPILTFTDPIAYSPSLPSLANLPHIFSQLWTAAPGVYDVCVITSEPNNGIDQNPFDDTTCITISVFDSVSVTSSNPYCTDFESGPQWVSVNALSYNSAPNDWEIGTPTQTIINSAHSGANAWTIDLDSNYVNRDSSGLFSPVFAIDNSKCYKLEFWHMYDTEPYADGGTVEYSTDYAATWQHLGFAAGTPQPWFNTPFITALGGSPGLPGWSGLQAVWTHVEKEAQFSGGNTVIFRFRFASDNTVNNYEGWAIDDVCFTELATPCVVGIPEVGTDGVMLGQNFPNPFNGTSTVDYFLPSSGDVKISITNLIGQEIAVPVNGEKAAGAHSFTINSNELGAGIYYYTLDFDGHQITRKMIITE